VDLLTPIVCKTFRNGEIYRANNKGPRIDPWIVPKFLSKNSELFFLTSQ
jgi:hypothetical protein